MGPAKRHALPRPFILCRVGGDPSGISQHLDLWRWMCEHVSPKRSVGARPLYGSAELSDGLAEAGWKDRPGGFWRSPRGSTGDPRALSLQRIIRRASGGHPHRFQETRRGKRFLRTFVCSPRKSISFDSSSIHGYRCCPTESSLGRIGGL